MVICGCKKAYTSLPLCVCYVGRFAKMLGSLYMMHMLKRPKYYIQGAIASAHSPTIWVGLPDIGSLFLIMVPVAHI